MSKALPRLGSDEEAEEFVATADLSEYDLSEFAPVQFQFGDEPPTVVLLPEALARRVDERAKRDGKTSQTVILEAIERALAAA